MTKDIRIPNNARNVARQVYQLWLHTAIDSSSVGMVWDGTVQPGAKSVMVYNCVTMQTYEVPVAASWSN